MENQQKLKDLLAFAMGQKKAEASPTTDMSGFNNEYLQAQAASPSMQTAAPNPEDSINAQIEQEGRNSLRAQEAELTRQRKLADIYAGSGAGQVDLSPLLQFSSQMTGIDIAKGYKAPPTAAQSAEQAQGMYAQLPKLQDALADNKLNLLKMKLAAAQRKGDNGRQERFDQAQDTQISFKLDQPYQKLQSEKNDFDRAYEVITGALDRGDVASVQGSLSMLARLSGEKGVLTDEDIARVVPVNLQSKMTQYLSKLRSDPETKVPADIVTALRNNIGGLLTAHDKTFRQSLTAVNALHAPTGGRIAELSGKKMNSLLDLLKQNKANANPLEQKDPLLDALKEMRGGSR